jgi:hypothetical protein
VSELEGRLRAAGLRIVCETPLARGRARASGFPGIAAEMGRSGSPFLQVLVCRAEAEAEAEAGASAGAGARAGAGAGAGVRAM